MLPFLLLAVSAGLFYLSVLDRMSPVALALVELETKVGLPLWGPFAAAGFGLLVVEMIRATARKAPPPPRRPLTRDAARTRAAAAPVTADPNWLAAIRVGALSVSDDPMGRVKFDEATGVPVALVLTGVTKEQARRRVAAYAAWLATIPAPPTAGVRLVSSPDLEGPIHAMLRGELGKHFAADLFHVTSRHDGADAVFSAPDPRWGA